MYESTVEISPPSPLPHLLSLPQNIPVPLPTPPLPPILPPQTPLPHRYSPGEIPTTKSHSIGKKADFHGRKWFQDHCGVKQNIDGTHSFCKWLLMTDIDSKLISGCE